MRLDGVALDADGDVTENGRDNTTFTLATPPAAGALENVSPDDAYRIHTSDGRTFQLNEECASGSTR